MLRLFVTVPRGMELLLAEEAKLLGAQAVTPTRAGVSIEGDLGVAYRLCLWSRVASRVLLFLHAFTADDPDALYAGVQAVDWREHMDKQGTLAVDFNATESRNKHTQYGALKVKDAIVDQFRDRTGERPSVDLEQPALRVNVNVHKNLARLSLDLSGQSLHRRGYRDSPVLAPLKENLAAAILLQCDWPVRAAAGASLVDPMCGSGTLPIEAAWMAGDVAPGLLRSYFGFLGWRGHDVQLWQATLAEAEERRAAGAERRWTVTGYDVDRTAVRAALANIARAGLAGRIHIERKELNGIQASGKVPGLVVVNPPYGERLDAESSLPKLYSDIGAVCKRYFPGWRLALFTGNTDLLHRIRLPQAQSWQAFNGALPCRLVQYQIPATETVPALVESSPGDLQTAGVEMFANRLRKNWRQLSRWAQRNSVACFRLYDADLPEFAIVVDFYSGEDRWVHVQEYRAPATVDPVKAAARLAAALSVIPEVLSLTPEHVFFKVRERQKGTAQYRKLGTDGAFQVVHEGDCRFLVNFTDYLDTGLFLDYRPVRELIHRQARGKRFLNLFAYTGTASVAAAHGGAASTTTVDLSTTYLDWARQNLVLNGFSGSNHTFVQSDCREWLATAGSHAGDRYDLILLDPPTFSNSKRMDGTLDIQRDHPVLIRHALALLKPGGELIFSTNRKHFRLDTEVLSSWSTDDVSRQTVAEDFRRSPTIHRCWRICKG